MQVSRIETQNFAGIGTVVIDGLDRRQEVVITGRNGVGKSQLLLAIAMAGSARLDVDGLERFVGYKTHTATVQVTFVLDRDEVRQLRDVLVDTLPGESFAGNELISTVELSRTGPAHRQWTDGTADSPVGSVLDNPFHREQLPFLSVTYLPPERFTQRNAESIVSLHSLSPRNIDELNMQAVAQELSGWMPSHAFEVFPSLAALHYAGLLEQQESGGTSKRLDELDSITDAFYRATGKKIEKPALDGHGEVRTQVVLPGGFKHDPAWLSSGELQALQLLHFTKLHLRQGSILLIDEPEQHLHPSLQVEIANAASGTQAAGQVWFVSHSPNIINALPTESVLVISRDDNGEGVVQSLDEQNNRALALRELGVSPGLWVPGNCVIILEGPTDETYLRQLLPEQTSRAFFLVAGTKSSVHTYAHTNAVTEVPTFLLCDRDFDTEESRTQWNSVEGRFMWSGRSIESLFLDPKWIHATLRRAYSDLSLTEIETQLAELYDKQRPGVLKQWKNQRIRAQVRDAKCKMSKSEFERAAELAKQRHEYSLKHDEDLEREFDELWDRGPAKLVDAKSVLKNFESGVFTTYQSLIGSMATTLHEDPTLKPADLREAERRLNALTEGI